MDQETDLLNIQSKKFSKIPLNKSKKDLNGNCKKMRQKVKLIALHLKKQRFRSKSIFNLYLHRSTINSYPLSPPASNAQWLMLPCPSITSCICQQGWTGNHRPPYKYSDACFQSLLGTIDSAADFNQKCSETRALEFHYWRCAGMGIGDYFCGFIFYGRTQDFWTMFALSMFSWSKKSPKLHVRHLDLMYHVYVYLYVYMCKSHKTQQIEMETPKRQEPH